MASSIVREMSTELSEEALMVIVDPRDRARTDSEHVRAQVGW